MSGLERRFSATKDLANKQMELAKLNIEISGLSREILEIQTAISQLERAKSYLKSHAHIVALHEYRNIVITLLSQRKRKKDLTNTKKEKEQMRKMVERQVQNIKSKYQITDSAQDNVIFFPTRTTNEQPNE